MRGRIGRTGKTDKTDQALSMVRPFMDPCFTIADRLLAGGDFAIDMYGPGQN